MILELTVTEQRTVGGQVLSYQVDYTANPRTEWVSGEPGESNP